MDNKVEVYKFGTRFVILCSAEYTGMPMSQLKTAHPIQTHPLSLVEQKNLKIEMNFIFSPENCRFKNECTAEHFTQKYLPVIFRSIWQTLV